MVSKQMKFYFFVIAVTVLFNFSALGQTAGQTAVVISPNANLRGTPTERGKVVDTLSEQTSLEVIKRKGAWFLVQSEDYVGWIHGNTIRLDDDSSPVTKQTTSDVSRNTSKIPRKTNKQPASGERLFEREYVGGTGNPTIYIKNDADRAVTLILGGVKYVISSGNSETLTIEPGNYEYFASAPRASSLSGVENYELGYRYSWTFFITRR